MYLDKQLLLSDTQVVANAASEISENIIDLGAAKNVARGRQMYAVIIVDVAFSTCTSINFQLWTHSTTTVTSGSIMCETGAIAVAALTANRTAIVLPVGDALNTAKQYVGMYYVLAGSVDAAGAVTTFLAFDAP